MKSTVLLVALLAAFAAVARSTDCDSWNDWFDQETDTCRPLCEEPPPPTKKTTPVVFPPSTLAPAAPTTVGGGDYSIVTEGYTPTPGECVCVSGSTISASSVPAESSPAPAASTIGELVSTPEAGASTPGEWHSHCVLIEVFYNFTLLFEGELQVVWLEFVHHCEQTIFAVVEWSAEVKFVKCVYALEALFVQYEEIRVTLQYQWVASWGYVIDLLTVAINVQYEYLAGLIVLDGEGSCPLFDALLNATADDQQQHDAVVQLIGELQVIIESSYYSQFDKYYLIYVKFEAFFAAHASWEATFLQIEIVQFFSLEQFVTITHVFEQISTVEVAIGGQGSECLLLQALLEASQNQSYSVSVRSDIQQFYQVCFDFFAQETDVYVRLEFFLNQSFEWYVLSEWVVEYVYGLELGAWGSFYELIAAGYFHQHCGWESHTTVLAASTTPALAESSTVAQGECGTRDELIAIDEQNSTLLTTALNEASASWSVSYQSQFTGYKKRVEVLIWSTTLSIEDKISNISQVLGNYATDERQTTLEAVQISWWGTVGQFCACSGF